jgi:hypothetical protein
MSHAQRAGATHARVTSIKMAWLILGIKRCGRTNQIDVTTDVHVEVSRDKEFGMTVENHAMYTDTTEKGQI